MHDDSGRAYLGLGSNLGDRADELAFALRELGRIGRVTGASGVFETAPQGFVEQPLFLNMVARLETRLEPRELLAWIERVERSRGRVRSLPNGPRTLDIDILLYGSVVMDEPGLTIPHPRMCERVFVLVPLLELEPAAMEPRTRRPYADYLREIGGHVPGDEACEESEGHAVTVRAPATGGSRGSIRRIMSAEELLDGWSG